MKTDNGYRYTLQFGCDTDAQIRVGDALERLGNRKSDFIIRAVSEYLDAHPEQSPGSKPSEASALLTRSDVRKLIMAVLVEMRVQPGTPTSVITQNNIVEPKEAIYEVDAQQADIDNMLRNLDVFR